MGDVSSQVEQHMWCSVALIRPKTRCSDRTRRIGQLIRLWPPANAVYEAESPVVSVDALGVERVGEEPNKGLELHRCGGCLVLIWCPVERPRRQP